MKKIIIAGCGFAGFAAAIELKRLVGEECEIEVISHRPLYVYAPALPGIPFGLREPEDISFDVRPLFAERGIGFRQERIVRIDPVGNTVRTSEGDHEFDYLLVALGPSAERMRPWGLGAAHTSWSINSLDDALRTRAAWQRFVLAPGPMVVGAADGAPLYAAHYQFLLNAIQDLNDRGIRDRVDIRFITAEPALGHFGAGGTVDAQQLGERLFTQNRVEWRAGVSIEEIRDNRVLLASGEEFPTAFTMIVPRFIGSDAVRASPGLGDELGLIPVSESCRHREFPRIFAAGLATTFSWEDSRVISGGLPMTIYPAERMAIAAASNIATAVQGGQLVDISFRDLAERAAHDAERMIDAAITGSFPQRRSHEVLQAGVVALTRDRFEKSFLEARARGEVR
jgi:sulfide:quinone oxidoreductase